MPSFYIVDGHGYSYQFFHAISHNLQAANGTPTNAVFGFTRFLEKILSQKPDYLAICFDSPGPTIRQGVFADYKANRKPMPDELRLQLPLIKELVQAYGIAIFEASTYEADDIMATLAQKGSQAGYAVYLVTQDKDLQQMIRDNQIQVYDIKEDKPVTAAEVMSKLQVKPSQLPDYFALIGDAIDNIPGIKGIGGKTAAKLLGNWENLEAIYEHIQEVTPERIRNLLIQNQETAFLSRRLFILDDHVPVEVSWQSCRVGLPDVEKLKAFFRKLDFHSFLKKWDDAQGEERRTAEKPSATIQQAPGANIPDTNQSRQPVIKKQNSPGQQLFEW